MYYYVSQLGKKFNRIRKKNWSAPTIMAAFILSCMLIIYSFESLGLSNKEKNLDYRISTPEKIIKVISNDITSKNYIPCSNECNQTRLEDKADNNLFDSNKFKIFTAKNKEEHLLEIQSILLEGAKYQYLYENNNVYKEDYFNYQDLYSFFDI
jgi:hypothetical protein